MTPLLVILSMVFEILLSKEGKKKIKRDSEVVPFDRLTGLKELFFSLGDNRKVCRYFFSGALKDKVICENEFECMDCHIHQRFGKVNFCPTCRGGVEKVSGFDFNTCYFYHRGHTFINIERNGYVRVGVDPLLRSVFRDAQKIMLFEEGEFVDMDDISFGIVKNGKVFPILSPISGEIVRINENILTELNGKVSKFPWVYVVKPFHLLVDLQKLFYGKEAINWFRYEIEEFVKEMTGNDLFAADGGVISFKDLEVNYDKFVENFLFSLKTNNGGIS